MHIYGIYKPFQILVSLLSFAGEVWYTCCHLQNRNGLDVKQEQTAQVERQCVEGCLSCIQELFFTMCFAYVTEFLFIQIIWVLFSYHLFFKLEWAPLQLLRSDTISKAIPCASRTVRTIRIRIWHRIAPVLLYHLDQIRFQKPTDWIWNWVITDGNQPALNGAVTSPFQTHYDVALLAVYRFTYGLAREP